ncbi:MAG: AAA family ATPase [Calditerrivibrio sp.]|nr:AAA family ATPase [Calditerrivibrio sp.]
MPLKGLNLLNFRNYTSRSFTFEKKNFIFGKNGSGKTSLLEAIYFIFTGKSFRTSRVSNLINNNSNTFRIDLRYEHDGIDMGIYIYYDHKKHVYINNKPVESIYTFYFNHPIAFYSPENEGFLSYEQEQRRKFLDRTIFYIDLDYLNLLKRYKKVCELKKGYIFKGIRDKLFFNVLNEQINDISSKIQKKRKKVIDKYNTILSSTITNIPSSGVEFFQLTYEPSVFNPDILEKEISTGLLLSGPHRDRISFQLNGDNADIVASFGQRKTISICCLYCFLKLVELFRKNDIIIILDELYSSLDTERAEYFMDIFNTCQLFVTGQTVPSFNDMNLINLN